MACVSATASAEWGMCCSVVHYAAPQSASTATRRRVRVSSRWQAARHSARARRPEEARGGAWRRARVAHLERRLLRVPLRRRDGHALVLNRAHISLADPVERGRQEREVFPQAGHLGECVGGDARTMVFHCERWQAGVGGARKQRGRRQSVELAGLPDVGIALVRRQLAGTVLRIEV